MCGVKRKYMKPFIKSKTPRVTNLKQLSDGFLCSRCHDADAACAPESVPRLLDCLCQISTSQTLSLYVNEMTGNNLPRSNLTSFRNYTGQPCLRPVEVAPPATALFACFQSELKAFVSRRLGQDGG